MSWQRGNPRLCIPFQLRDAASVRISVYNARGQVVRRFPEQALAAGYHQLTWDGTSDNGTELPTGTYVIRARISDGEWKARTVLMK